MSRYQFVIKVGAGVFAAGLALGPVAAFADDTEAGAAAKVGGSLGVLQRDDQPDRGSGTFDRADGTDLDAEASGDRTVSVEILTETDLSVDGDAFVELVMGVLNDDRGWGQDGSVVFDLVGEDAELTIMLATAGTVDDMCAPLNTNGYMSCRVEDDVVLNVDRWFGATTEFLDAGGTLDQYRTYLVNHEVGHFFGRGHETQCGPEGKAPVMMQQTLGLGGCEPNGWPSIP